MLVAAVVEGRGDGGDEASATAAAAALVAAAAAAAAAATAARVGRPRFLFAEVDCSTGTSIGSAGETSDGMTGGTSARRMGGGGGGGGTGSAAGGAFIFPARLEVEELVDNDAITVPDGFVSSTTVFSGTFSI